MNCVQSGIMMLCVFAILVNGQQYGMDANMMGGHPGSVPMNMAQEAAALYARGFNSDQIDDILAEPPHLRPMEEARQRSRSAMEAARHTAQSAFMSSMLGGATGNSAGGALSSGAGTGTHAASVSQGGAGWAGQGMDLFRGSGATGGADATAQAAVMVNPMRPADPFLPGSSTGGALYNVGGAHAHTGSVAQGGAGGAGQDMFANLMAGHMQRAQETAALRARGFSSDQAEDILALPPHMRPAEEARQAQQNAMEAARQAQQSAMEAARHAAESAFMSSMLRGAAGAQHAGPGGVNMYQPNPQQG